MKHQQSVQSFFYGSSILYGKNFDESVDNQRLKALGNAVTPQQACVALKALEHWLG